MDDELRQHELAARRGDPGAEARLLATRLRAGQLTADRVRLAALVGHEPAVSLVGESDGAQPADTEFLVRALKPFGPAVFQRAGSAVREALVVWRRRPLVPFFDRLDDWLLCPNDVNRVLVLHQARRCQLGHWDLRYIGPVLSLTRSAVGRRPAPPPPRYEAPRRRQGPRDPTGQRDRWCCAAPLLRDRRRNRLRNRKNLDEAIHATICEELRQWALGEADPVLRRRQRRAEG
ncbi:hypothetical protein OAX78_04670 [Planctomycetota bacterium]|nr:hypothetical protein [Planctomycetota bacterium]